MSSSQSHNRPIVTKKEGATFAAQQHAPRPASGPAPPGWSVARRRGDPPPRHPLHDENEARLRTLLLIVPAAKTAVQKPKGYRIQVQEAGAFPAIDAERFVNERTRDGGSLRRLTKADDIVWLRGDLAKKTFKVLDMDRDGVQDKGFALPTGAGVLRLRGAVAELVPMIYGNLRDLFRREKERPTEGLSFPGCDSAANSKRILGYSKTATSQTRLQHTMPTLADLLSYLDPATRNFIVSVAKAVADFMGVGDHARILHWTMILIEYPPHSGFNWHVDGISDFGSYPGVVINVAVGEPGTGKGFDMHDLLDPDGGGPYRLVLEQGDLVILSGAPRIGSAHSVPKMSGTQLTVAFKLPFEDLGGPNAPAWVKLMAQDPQVAFDRPVYALDFMEAYAAQKEKRAAAGGAGRKKKADE